MVRFWKFVARGQPDQCWPWVGAKDGIGYGLFRITSSRIERAHRVALRLSGTPVERGKIVCHRCNNPTCCNPAHLYVGTPKTNADDREAAGRHAHGERSGRAKLTEADVRAIRSYPRGAWLTGRAFGVSPGAVAAIRAGRNWRRLL